MQKREQDYAEASQANPDILVNSSISAVKDPKFQKLPLITSPGGKLQQSEEQNMSIDEHDSDIGTNLAARMDTEGNTLQILEQKGYEMSGAEYGMNQSII